MTEVGKYLWGHVVLAQAGPPGMALLGPYSDNFWTPRMEIAQPLWATCACAWLPSPPSGSGPSAGFQSTSLSAHLTHTSLHCLWGPLRVVEILEVLLDWIIFTSKIWQKRIHEVHYSLWWVGRIIISSLLMIIWIPYLTLVFKSSLLEIKMNKYFQI